ncbi:MAG: M12 family metallo-peptidase [Candidatus Binatia bacterium]|nr:M12 family metallo-peptidase [Candidatus Binatia bacterium]
MTTPLRTARSILSLLLLSACASLDPAPPAPARVVRVKALADIDLMRDDPRWQSTVRDLINAASDYFEKEFGIRLVLRKAAPWPGKDRSLSTRRLMKALKAKVPLSDRAGSYDLIIGFIGQQLDIYGSGLARVDRIGDCKRGLGNYVLTAVSEPFRYSGPDSELGYDVASLIHEFAHIFGAVHVNDSTSIMHRDFAFRTEFDSKNRAIIIKNRSCPFGKG